MSSSNCSKGSTVLVTGANGYIGGHIVNVLLQYGLKVRGTVRDQTKASWVEAEFHKRHDPSLFSTVIVPNVDASGALDNALDGCSGIIHAAADLSMSGDITLIERFSTGTKNILESASRTPSIKRFVYTSTCCAAAEPTAGFKVHLEPDMWNETSLKKAQAEPPHPPNYGFLVYYAAKVEAEKLAWNFIKEKSPSFVFNSILLNFNMGPFIFNDHPGGSGGLIKGIYEGDPMLVGIAQSEIIIPSQQCVDVRDTARLHLAALIEEDVKSERLFSAAFPYSYNGLIKAFKALAPEGKQLPDIIEGLAESGQTANNARSEELLKRLGRPGWGQPEDFIRDNILGEVN